MNPKNKKTIGYKVGAHEDPPAIVPITPERPRNEFARRPTTDVRLQSLLHRDAVLSGDEPTMPKRPNVLFTSLDETTQTGSAHPATFEELVPLDDLADLNKTLEHIAGVTGFIGAVILDAEWGDLLATRSTSAGAAIDLELAGHLSYSSLPTKGYYQPIREITSTTTEHYEITTLLDGPFLSLIMFTIWDRHTANLAIARMEIEDALRGCSIKKSIHSR
jgi:hypothetical protein